MTAVISAILRVAALVLSGVGLSNLLDKFVKDKVPSTYYPEPISPGMRIPKILWLIFAFFLAFMALRFIGKKFKIRMLKY